MAEIDGDSHPIHLGDCLTPNTLSYERYLLDLVTRESQDRASTMRIGPSIIRQTEDFRHWRVAPLKSRPVTDKKAIG